MPVSFQVEQVPLDDLHPDPANPRRISEAQLDALMRSMREYGAVQPVVANRKSNELIAGHQRLLAARALGLKDIPVVFVDLPRARARILGLALNKIGGSWDEMLLQRLLADLNDRPDVDLTLSGFAGDEISQLLIQLEAHEKRERPELFDLELAMREATTESRCHPGDMWLLGEHRLMCGDATDASAVAGLIATERIAMAFTDPPYNVNYGHHGGRQRRSLPRSIANDALTPEAWLTFVRAWATNLVSVTDGAIYVCMSSREWPVVASALGDAGGHWSDTLIWAKDRFVLGRGDYQRGYEPMWYGWRQGVARFWCGDRNQSDVWHVARPTDAPLHPVMKPLALMERAIDNSSQAGDRVLDLFGGSGSTLIACERTGRRCALMELDPIYVDVTLRRWESFTGRRAIRAAEANWDEGISSADDGSEGNEQ